MAHSSSRYSSFGRWQHLSWVSVVALPLALWACKSQSSSSFHAPDAAIGPPQAPDAAVGPLQAPDAAVGPLQAPDAAVGPLQAPDAAAGPLQAPDAAVGPLQAPDAAVGPLQAPDAGTSHLTEFSILVSPQRAIDILFMIDNSPSMDPKQQALANNFPKMIATLEALPGGLPDVHIGVVSSNMGAGGGAMGGNCGSGLGDRGLLWGNDPNDLTASVADGGPYATNLIAPGCGLYLGARWIEDIQAPSPGTGRQRNYSTNLQLQDVFSCLARAVGISGCGQEHHLQATRVALIPQAGINEANNGFVRSSAYLAIVLVADEDDCSAAPESTKNDNLFDMVGRRNPGDTTSLRCAARGHLCGGQPIPNYDPVVGYTGTTPFTHNFTDCSAKAQKTPPDYAYMPLIGVQEMIDSVNWVKGSMAAQKILVSGIIGWPPGPNDASLPAGVQTNDQYRIDKDATSAPASQATLWDYMPTCLDPARKAPDGNIYKAYGGLRLKQFIDSYGANGQTFSICNSDFTNALTRIGQSIAAATSMALKPGCVSDPLVGTNLTTPVLTQPICQARDRVPCDAPGVGNCPPGGGYTDNPLPECKDGSGHGLDPSVLDPSRVSQFQIDAVLASVSNASRPCWYLSYDNSASGCASSYKGQRISALRPIDTVAPPGTILALQCLTCSASEPKCPAQ